MPSERRLFGHLSLRRAVKLGRRAVGLLAVPALLALGGCDSVTKVEPTRRLTVVAETGKTRTIINAKMGDQIKLELPPVELKGFGWQIFRLDSRFVKQQSEVIPAATPDGRPSITLLAFQPTQKAIVRFLLVKLDDAKTSQPVDGHDVVFTIQ